MGRFADFVEDYKRRGKLITSATYGRLLGPFEKWLNANKLPGVFTVAEVEKYIDSKPKWTAATKNSFLASLRSWAKRQKSLTPAGNDINEVVQYRAVEKNLEAIAAMKSYTITLASRRPLTLDEIRNVLKGASNSSWDFQTIWSLLALGVRANELTTIKEADIKPIENGCTEVTIHSLKTGTIGATRTLYCDPYSTMCLRSITNESIRKYTRLEPGPILSSYAWAIESRKLFPHLMRHTFASYMALLVTERVLSEGALVYMLGHAPPTQTAAYIHPFAGEIKTAMLDRHFMKVLEPPDFKPPTT